MLLHRRWPTLRDWILVGLVAGVLRALWLVLAGAWGLHRMAVAALAARSLDRCPSEVRNGALLLGAVGWILAGAGIALAEPSGAGILRAGAALAGAAGFLAMARALVRRGSP